MASAESSLTPTAAGETPDSALKPCDLTALATFEFDRVLSQNTLTGSAFLLGKLHGDRAIIHVQRTALDSAAAPALVKDGLEALDVFLDNRPYFSAHALIARGETSPPDVALKLIWPCTDVHIQKYTVQSREILHETPAVYAAVVEPYISSFPPERTAWVHAILDGVKEAERVVFRDDDPRTGFVLLPDLKWDGTTLSALYLTALVRDGSIRSLRDLSPRHIPLLKKIRTQAYASCNAKYGVESGQLRLFIHYQPSYYHFHVHIVHIQHEAMAGMAVGQAHLLEDVINWLELSSEDGPALTQRMTFTYALGVQHGLYAALKAAQEPDPKAQSDAVEDAAAAQEETEAAPYDETPGSNATAQKRKREGDDETKN